MGSCLTTPVLFYEYDSGEEEEEDEIAFIKDERKYGTFDQRYLLYYEDKRSPILPHHDLLITEP